MQGGTPSAASYAANAFNPFAESLMSASQNTALTSALAKQFSPFGGTPQGGFGQQGQYLAGAFSNPQTQQAQMLAAQNLGF